MLKITVGCVESDITNADTPDKVQLEFDSEFETALEQCAELFKSSPVDIKSIGLGYDRVSVTCTDYDGEQFYPDYEYSVAGISVQNSDPLVVTVTFDTEKPSVGQFWVTFPVPK